MNHAQQYVNRHGMRWQVTFNDVLFADTLTAVIGRTEYVIVDQGTRVTLVITDTRTSQSQGHLFPTPALAGIAAAHHAGSMHPRP